MNFENKVFLSNLPSDSTEYSIITLFSQYGKLTDFSFPVHKEGSLRGKTLGYCFGSFSTAQAALAAISKLNGIRFSGKTLVAKLASARADEARDELVRYEYDDSVLSQRLRGASGVIDGEHIREALEQSRIAVVVSTTRQGGGGGNPKHGRRLLGAAPTPSPGKRARDRTARIKQLEDALTRLPRL